MEVRNKSVYFLQGIRFHMSVKKFLVTVVVVVVKFIKGTRARLSECSAVPNIRGKCFIEGINILAAGGRDTGACQEVCRKDLYGKCVISSFSFTAE